MEKVLDRGIYKTKFFSYSLLIQGFLLFFAFYLPFEDFFLKFFPVTDKVYIFLRQTSDFILFILYVIFFFKVLQKGRLNVPSRILILVFIIFSLYILLLNVFISKMSLTVFANVKALLRYIPLVFIIYNLNFSEQFKVKFIKLVLILVSIEAIIGYAQIIVGNTIVSIFAPKLINNPELGLVFTSSLAVINNTGEVFGTMPYTINYALFLVVGIILWVIFAESLYKVNTLIIFIGAIFFMIPLYFSGSRAGFFAAIMALLLAIKMKHGIKIFALFLSVIISLFVFLYPFLPKHGNNQVFWAFLSPSFIEILKMQRLGLIESFFKNIFDPALILGIGSERATVWNFVANNWNLPFYMGQIVEDVYWLALIIYYGFSGLFIFIIFLILIYYKLNKLLRNFSLTYFQRKLIYCAKIFILLIVPLNFVNQSLEVKTFSFYLWTILAFSLSCRKRREQF